jgi:hypothetical protein
VRCAKALGEIATLTSLLMSHETRPHVTTEPAAILCNNALKALSVKNTLPPAGKGPRQTPPLYLEFGKLQDILSYFFKISN